MCGCPKRGFNTQPPEGGWAACCLSDSPVDVSTHSRPKAAGTISSYALFNIDVSTHSRPKAAGQRLLICFGEWCWFQHTAARRRLVTDHVPVYWYDEVSTHSRPKAAGFHRQDCISAFKGFNTQPPEGGWRVYNWDGLTATKFQHTAARRRLEIILSSKIFDKQFQHTAARRRLGDFVHLNIRLCMVSTHSRPKAAGSYALRTYLFTLSFNTQPPEGGWGDLVNSDRRFDVSTHSRPKAAGASLKSLAPSGFAAPISLSSQEKQKCEYNTAFSVTPAFTIS